MRISDISLADRPREKALCQGIKVLNDRELLAVLIGSGTAKRSALDLADELLLCLGSLSRLDRLEHPGEISIIGLGSVRLLQIIAAIELGRRVNAASAERQQIKGPADLFSRFRYQMPADREQLLLLMLDNSGRILGERLLYQGTSRGFPLDPRDIFTSVLKAGAVRFVLIHNHPSGCPRPSMQDNQATSELELGAKKLGLKLIDHLIFGTNEYFSYFELKNSSLQKEEKGTYSY